MYVCVDVTYHVLEQLFILHYEHVFVDLKYDDKGTNNV